MRHLLMLHHCPFVRRVMEQTTRPLQQKMEQKDPDQQQQKKKKKKKSQIQLAGLDGREEATV